MKKFILSAVAAAMLGLGAYSADVVSAAPAKAAVVSVHVGSNSGYRDRGRYEGRRHYRHVRHHRRHQSCYWHHHRRICSWR